MDGTEPWTGRPEGSRAAGGSDQWGSEVRRFGDGQGWILKTMKKAQDRRSPGVGGGASREGLGGDDAHFHEALV